MLSPTINATADTFSSFLESLQPILSRHAAYYVSLAWSCHLEADDLIQEAFCQIWQSRERVLSALDPTAYSVAIAKTSMVKLMQREITPHRVISLDEPIVQASGDTCPFEIEARPEAALSAENEQARRRVLALARRYLTARQRHALFLTCGIAAPRRNPHPAWTGTYGALHDARDRAMRKLRALATV